MNDDELLRYSRQILLSEIDAAGQQRLAASTALIIGAGGLGSAAALYLGAAGAGRLLLADGDRVERSNLQRQIAHTDADLGREKARSAAEAVARRNPGIHIEPLAARLEGAALAERVRQADVVVDGSDNFATRFAVNAACTAAGRPLVSAAVIRWELQLSVFAGGGRPCYRCLFSEGEAEGGERCSETGVVGPLPGVGGSLQALEAIKVLTGAGRPLYGRLLVMDTLGMRTRTLEIPADPACPVCGGAA